MKYRTMKKIVLLFLSLCVLFLSISAGCTTTIRNFDSEGHKAMSDTDAALVIESDFTASFGVNSNIVGQIKNNSDKTFRTVKIKINLYKYGAQIGNQMATLSNLGPGDTWKFTVASIGGTEYADAYKVIEISGS